MPTEEEGYLFTRNDPYDRAVPIELVVPRLIDSRAYMDMIRSYKPEANALAVWYPVRTDSSSKAPPAR